MRIRSLICFLFFYVITNIAFPQTSLENYQKYFKSGDYINAKKEIESATLDPINAKNAKIWISRSEVNTILYSNKPSEYPSNIEIAYMSIMKASFLDAKKEFSKDIFNQLKLISQLYYKKGADDFNIQKYTYALLSFERSIEIDNLMNIANNTDKIYYAGLAASLSNNNEKTKKYFTPLYTNNYQKIEVYNYLANAYKAENNNSKTIEILKKGINLFPNNSYLLVVNIVKLFLNLGLTSDAIEYLKIGTSLYQKDDLFYLQGSLYVQLKQDNFAIQSFQKAVEINPNNADASYNLGIMLYNSSINHLKTADSFLNSNQEKYNNEKEIYLTEIKKSAPLLEKALEHDNTNKNTMNCLLDIYKRLQRKEQYDKLKVLLSSTK